IAVSSVLGLIMFGVGLSLTAADFKRIILHPRAFFTALGAQMVGLPIIAFIISLIAPLPAELKVGFIILSASPGGATSGFLTYLWRGNVALSLSITSVNSFLTLFSIPIVVNIGLQVFLGRETDLHLPFLDTVSHIFFITIIPAALGVLVRRHYPDAADRLSKPAQYVMRVLLAIVFAIKMFAGENYGGAGLTMRDFLIISPIALIQNASCLFFGYFFMKWMGLDHSSRITAAMESGVQNTTLAFLIASTLIGNEEMVKPALVYSLYSFWTACLFAYTSNKLNQSPVDSIP
ncbi:MAG: bile acid:sodium symporter family protein, partial [Saprospiraceae bacterium]|nr:bile acid:sodium symporter family protein [Saprospiraceae bacterium]